MCWPRFFLSFRRSFLNVNTCTYVFFLKNTVQTQSLTYTRIHSPLWPHTRTPSPYEHLWKTDPADRVLKLMKSPQAPRYRRERRLSLKEYSAFMRHTHVKPGVWTLVGWGYNHPPNHPTSGWFSCMYEYFVAPTLKCHPLIRHTSRHVLSRQRRHRQWVPPVQPHCGGGVGSLTSALLDTTEMCLLSGWHLRVGGAGILTNYTWNDRKITIY
jgi:hypothetical protein